MDKWICRIYKEICVDSSLLLYLTGCFCFVFPALPPLNFCFVFPALPPLKKNFYIENIDVANMHPETVKQIRYDVLYTAWFIEVMK